jgi:hypothetical protein
VFKNVLYVHKPFPTFYLFLQFAPFLLGALQKHKRGVLLHFFVVIAMCYLKTDL